MVGSFEGDPAYTPVSAAAESSSTGLLFPGELLFENLMF